MKIKQIECPSCHDNKDIEVEAYINYGRYDPEPELEFYCPTCEQYFTVYAKEYEHESNSKIQN